MSTTKLRTFKLSDCDIDKLDHLCALQGPPITRTDVVRQLIRAAYAEAQRDDAELLRRITKGFEPPRRGRPATYRSPQPTDITKKSGAIERAVDPPTSEPELPHGGQPAQAGGQESKGPVVEQGTRTLEFVSAHGVAPPIKGGQSIKVKVNGILMTIDLDNCCRASKGVGAGHTKHCILKAFGYVT